MVDYLVDEKEHFQNPIKVLRTWVQIWSSEPIFILWEILDLGSGFGISGPKEELAQVQHFTGQTDLDPGGP